MAKPKHAKAKNAPKKPAKPTAKKTKRSKPLTFADQLGVKEGAVIVCLHCKEQFLTRMRNQLPPYARLFPTVPEGRQVDIIIRFFNEHADFDSSFRWLERQLTPDGIIWGVIPKKSVLKKGERYLLDDMVKAAHRTTLQKARELNFSPVEQAVKFTIRKEHRKKE